MKKLMVMGLVAVFVVSGLLSNLSRPAMANEVSDKEYIPYLQPISETILASQNMSFTGRPFALDERNGDVYLAGGGHLLDVWKYNTTSAEYTELYTGFVAGSALDVIKCGLVTDNGYIFVSRSTNNTFYRSIDGGVTFEPCLVMATGAFGWGMAANGSDVYVGEYGDPDITGARVFKSDDYGSTWSTVWTSLVGSGVYPQHIHRIAIDPYTGYVHVSVGDEAHQFVRSTDGGLSFHQWGPPSRFTAMCFDEESMYCGHDPKDLVYVYNRTDKTWATKYLGSDTSENCPVYDMVVGKNGVIYARTFDDTVTGIVSGIWASPNGYDWAMVLNLTCLSVDGNIFLHVGEDGYIYYGTAFSCSQYAVYLWRFHDLSKAEAWVIVKQSEPRPSGISYTYDDGIRASNNSISRASLQQDVLTDAELSITGVRSANLFANGMFDTVMSLNATPPAVGWSNASYYGAENFTRTMLRGVSHTGEYSVQIQSLEAPNDTLAGKVWFRSIVEVALRQPAGTPITVSYWRSSSEGNLSSGYFGGYVLSTFLVRYLDTSTETKSFDGSVHANGTYGQCSTYDNMTWGRRWMTWTPSAAQQIDRVEISFEFYGNYTLILDDIQCQFGTMLTPAISVYAENTTSVDVNVTTDGLTHQFGTLDYNDEVSVLLGVISGLIEFDFDINGSECVNWTITGSRLASSWGALIDVDSENITYATHIYDGAAIEFWGGGCTIDAATFLDPDDSSTIYLACDPLIDRVNTTISAWGASMVWVANNSATWTVSGLDPDTGYKVYQDGVLVYQQLEGFTTLSFEATGGGRFEVVVWEPQPSSGPMASFEYTLIGNLLTCVDKSYNGVVLWVWNFGDGYGSTDQSPSHKYVKAGWYTLSLTVYDSEGRSSLATTQIEVVLGTDMPVERDDDGWNIFVSDTMTLGISAAGLIVGGAIMFASSMYIKMPIITPKGRRVLGLIMMIAGAYFFIFIDNAWLG